MNLRVLAVILVFSSVARSTFANGLQSAKPDIYDVLQSDDSAKINSTLSALSTLTIKEKDAYTGTLLMKKSGMLKNGLDKLNLFKQGRKLLEASIKQDSTNAEYRFLRLMIQEKAPDFLNYHSKKEIDANMIKDSYASFPSPLKEAIREYSQKSHILKPEDFKK